MFSDFGQIGEIEDKADCFKTSAYHSNFLSSGMIKTSLSS